MALLAAVAVRHLDVRLRIAHECGHDGGRPDVGDRTLTEGQAEHLGQQADQALEADRLGDVQMNDQRAQPWPELASRARTLQAQERPRTCGSPGTRRNGG